MEILRRILESIKEDAGVQEVRRGLYWTAVVSKRCGLASSLGQGGCGHEETDGMEGSYTDMTALELARSCLDGNTVNTNLAIAAINSLLDVDVSRCSDADGLHLVKKIARGKNISVIGHFPYLDDLAGEAKNLWIIEKNMRPGDHSEEEGKALIPRSDIVVISSTTLINDTLRGILDLCREETFKMLLGPSTPLSEVLFTYGIDILAGSIVTENEPVLRSVSEGVSFMQLKKRGGVRFVSMVNDRV